MRNLARRLLMLTAIAAGAFIGLALISAVTPFAPYWLIYAAILGGAGVAYGAADMARGYIASKRAA